LWQAPSADIAATQLRETSAEVSEIVFFLMGAMTIVEIVDSHQGFKIVTDSITTRNPRLLLWVVGAPLIFFFSHPFTPRSVCSLLLPSCFCDRVNDFL
jgi:Na+/H+ antiporter NhaD/arsenite permease-like protein